MPSEIVWVREHLPWLLSPSYILAGCVVILVVLAAVLLWKGIPEALQFRAEIAGAWLMRQLVWACIIVVVVVIVLWTIACVLGIISAIGAFFVSIAHELGLLKGWP